MNHRLLLPVLILCATAISAALAQTSQPVLIDATDSTAIAASIGRDVIVQGIVLSAQWNPAGSVMSIEFKGAEKSRLNAVVFQKQRKAFDEAFRGDVCKSLAGSKVRVKGALEIYKPQGDASKGHPEIILDRPDQITIVEPVN